MTNPRRILIAFALVAWLGRCEFSQSADVIDMTDRGNLSDLPGILSVPISKHLWALHDVQRVTYSDWWKAAENRAKAGQWVVTNIEPDEPPKAVAHWRRPIVPLAEFNGGRPTSLEDVRETHRLIAERLSPLCEFAKKGGGPVYDYRTLQVNSLEMCNSRFAEWSSAMDSIIQLKCWREKSLAKLLDETGGGVVFEVYVPDAWNVAAFWGQQKAVSALERHAAKYKEHGVRAMPLLYAYTVGGPEAKPVKPEIMFALINAARSRYGAQWGFYNEHLPLPAGVKEFLR